MKRYNSKDMKVIIVLGALILSMGSFAQGRSEVVKAKKEIGKAQTDVKDKASKGQQMADDKVKGAKEKAEIAKAKGKEKMENAKAEAKGKMDNAKEKINNGNAYGKDKLEETGREFGQNRAAAAKEKAKEVKSEVEAEEMIESSKEETKQSISSIDEKMVAARTKLTDKLAAKEITQDQFTEKMAKLMEFEKRKNAIITSME